MTAARKRAAGLAAALAAALAALALAAPAARAEFGIVHGSAFGKAHGACPLAVGPAKARPSEEREVDAACIRGAEPAAEAGSHPDASGGGELEDTFAFQTKDFVLKTPPGFLANATVVQACEREEFRLTIERIAVGSCSPASQVGVATTEASAGTVPVETTPVYRLTPSPGYPLSFGFRFTGLGVVVNANLRTDEDYGAELGARDIPTASVLKRTAVTLWGVPADPAHDPERWDPAKGAIDPETGSPTGDWGASPGLARAPFIQLPTDCENRQLLTTATIASWQEPGRVLPDDPFDPTYALPAPRPTECEKLSFEPSIRLVPSATDADSPTGISVQMEVPQNQQADGRSTPQLREAVVTLPEGMSVNPAAADGIRGCSPSEIGLLTTSGRYPNPIRFARGEAECPQASKVGTGVVRTPLLDEPLQGDAYLATPYENPFGSVIALYLVFRGPGFTVKVPGRVRAEPGTHPADPQSGRLRTTFEYLPQAPFEDLELNFFGGPRAPLATPRTCGEKPISTRLEPWSTPYTPDARPSNRYEADRGPGGGPCSPTLASRPFAPSLLAGTRNPLAGGASAFELRLRRPDGHQELSGLTVVSPPGFAAYLKGVPYCSEAAIAVSATRSGAYSAARPDCPAASRVGTVLAGAGAGPTPYFVAGSAYLAGPYKGAPLSLVTITPALAGGTPADPVFDLGTVLVRVALHVHPRSAQITAIADPVPQVLNARDRDGTPNGFPLRVRDVRVVLDRPNWVINPTSCAPMSVAALAAGQSGALAPLANRFQLAGCARLGFEPRLFGRLFGGTGRGANPKFRAVLVPRRGDANIERAAVTLPRSAFLDQSHIRTVCTRVQFAAERCPKRAIYGRAVAHSPLLDRPLRGPVYLRSSDNLLPDLVADLRGQVDIEVVGRVDSIRGGIRTTFDAAPDAPVSKFVLTMRGGNRGLLVNSRNLCARPSRMVAKFDGHNGRFHDSKPLLKNSCGRGAR